jgi:hypothetical protein
VPVLLVRAADATSASTPAVVAADAGRQTVVA